jgi:NADH dehydrogenase/NADH:ubiquinone oxidoreductase subunit G
LFNIYKDLFNLDDKLEIILGQDTDLETAIVLKHFFNKLNCFSLYTEESFDSNSNDIFFRFNKKIKDVAKETDLCILVNSDTRFEASMLNLHLRKNFTKGKLNLGYFGPVMDLTFKTNHLGLDNSSFFNLIKGKHPICKELKKSKKLSFILNSNSFSNK